VSPSLLGHAQRAVSACPAMALALVDAPEAEVPAARSRRRAAN
jgi:hypothetical protein